MKQLINTILKASSLFLIITFVFATGCQEQTDYSADKGSSANGLENLKKVIAAFKAAYPDLKLVFTHEFYAENQYAGHWSFTGTNTGPGEIPPTGKSVSQWGINIIHFKDGKIVEEWDGFDNVPLLEQLGYTMTPPSSKKK